MKKPKVIIFDFDGTLADTAPLIRKIYGELAAKNQWRTLNDEDYEMLRKGTLDDARRWAGIRFWQLPAVARSAQRLMSLESEKVSLFPGMSELVVDLHTQGYELYVLSRNSVETIRQVLERHNLDGELTILSLRRFPFGNKSEVIKRLLRQKRCPPSDVVMVGDEVRDVQAATNNGVPSIAVSWGLQHESILGTSHPAHLVHTVDELRTILQ